MASGWLELGKLDPGPGGSPEQEVMVQQSSGMSLPAWANSKNAKLAGMGLVAGTVVGVVVVPFLAKRKIISKSKAWHASAVGAAVAVPLVAMYA
jgi:hypothetical protein